MKSASNFHSGTRAGRRATLRFRAGVGVLALGGLFLGLIGCEQVFMQKKRCPELPACGLDNNEFPEGNWILAPGHPSCSEDLYLPPNDPRLMGNMVPTARMPLIEPALFDWCDLLVTAAGETFATKEALFYFQDGHVGSATIKFMQEAQDDRTHFSRGMFTAGLTQTGHYKLDIPAFCMRAFGAKPKPTAADPMGPAVPLCTLLAESVKESGIGEGAFPNGTCMPRNPDDGGCVCDFDVTATSGPNGAYQQINKNTIVSLPGTGFPQSTNFCYNKAAGTLKLTGADGQYLFGRTGLRTLDLVKMPVQAQ